MRAGLLLALALLAACRGDAPGDPPRMTGREACARCGMAVSERRFAGGWVGEDGASVLYDDAGELLAALEAKPEALERAWVGDLESGAWVRAKDASFVRSPGLATPMGSGVAAFGSAAAAAAFVAAHPGAAALTR